MLDINVKYIVEVAFGLGLAAKALMFAPQAWKLHKAKKSDELSLLTFLGLNIMQLLTVLHAYFNQDRLLMIGTLLSFIFCSSVTFMIIFYRTRPRV